MNTSPVPMRSGLPFAFACYTIWGLMPLYIKALGALSAFEVLAHRIIWSVPITLAALRLTHQFGALRAAASNRRAVLTMLASSMLISLNWGIYMWAVMHEQVLATSLGYYLNPLVNVLLGGLVLGERLNRAQKAAVAIAGVAVAIMLAAEPGSIWISMGLAFSFGGYGLVRKMAPVESVPGLALEVSLLLPFAAAAAWFLATPAGWGSSLEVDALLIGMGLITAVPLMMFGIAARRMSYTALGFVQYLAPTIVFFLSVFLWHEPLNATKLLCFALIWAAIGLFSVDALRRMCNADSNSAIAETIA